MSQILNLTERYMKEPAEFPKGSPEWCWFAEFYMLVKTFWNIERNEFYWLRLTGDVKALTGKYESNAKLKRFNQAMTFALMDFLEHEPDPEQESV